jgi:hypothetical protein
MAWPPDPGIAPQGALPYYTDAPEKAISASGGYASGGSNFSAAQGFVKLAIE